MHSDGSRNKVLVAGRRFGKTHLAAVELGLPCIMKPGTRVGYMAPTFDQAKVLMWPVIEELFGDHIVDQDASLLVKVFRNGSRLRLFGGAKYDRVRGDKFHKFVIDEAQDIDREAWTKAVRPALSDLKGGALFIFTPKGRGNWTYDLWTQAVSLDGWSRHHFTTLEGGWVDEEEIAAARAELDERAFRQEYEASFEHYGGLVYYGFDDVVSTSRPMPFNPTADTWMCWDFNAGERPMSVIIVQKIEGVYYATKEFVYKNTNTEEMCQSIERFLQDNQFAGHLRVCGDHYGVRRESNASKSDYLIIENNFKHRGPRTGNLEIKHLQVHHISDRVNALNSLFRAGDGYRRLYIDPSCKALIRGLQRVTWKDSGSGLQETTVGEIDPTDALSYFAYNYHPVHKRESKIGRL